MKNATGAPFKAYLDSDKENHIICSECPDKDATVRLVDSMESKREIAAAFHGNLVNHFHKGIQWTICDDCLEAKENAARKAS